MIPIGTRISITHYSALTGHTRIYGVVGKFNAEHNMYRIDWYGGGCDWLCEGEFDVLTTVYDRIKTMTKDELQHLIHYIYRWGHINEQCGVDDKCFYEHLLDLPAHHCDNIIDALDNLKLYNVCVYSFGNEAPAYLSIKFFGVDDAGQYLTKHIRNITKVDDTTYVTPTNIYRIIPCMKGSE